MPSYMTAVEVLTTCLENEGVEYVFGVPGAAITALYEALLETPIKHILAKHEEGAAYMAAGYARASRSLGVCFVTTGPGGTNALTGIASAQADSAPVLIFTGQASTHTFGKGALQESSSFGVDLVQIFRPVTKMSAMVPNAARMQEMVQSAFRAALTGRPGPVHLSLPVDLLKQDVQAQLIIPTYYRVQARPVDYDAIERAARFLTDAEHPCILVGHGVTVAGASRELLNLAVRHRIPVATTPKGKGAFPETHPLALGVFGFGGHPRAESYLLADYVDVLLVIGTSLGELTTHDWEKNLMPRRALLHMDIDATQIGKNYPTEVGILADARAGINQLDLELQKLEVGRKVRDDDPLKSVRDELPRFVGTEYRSAEENVLKPQRVIDELCTILPDDAMLFVDNGNCILWCNHFFEIRKPDTYFLNLGLGSMGAAVAGVIGGKLAAPDKPVVAIVGDAAFAMNGMEVHTAAENDIAAIWVVLNNQGHGMVYHGEKMALGRDLKACRFKVPLDIAGLAAAMGARSFSVDTPRAFRDALETALKVTGPCVIDTKVDAEEVPYLLARRARTVAKVMTNMPPSMRIPKWPR